MAIEREARPRPLRKLTPTDVWGALEPDDAIDTEGRRGSSSIQFPYGDLNDAVEVARAIYNHAGSSGGSWEQIAEWLGYANVSSGAFRNKVATARIFGLTETKTGGAALTSLGVRILDPARERAARSTAFLNVPLFRALYDSYLGMTLPPDPGLEREMVSLGVSAKQQVRARQIFQRAADQAGYFGLGRNKLVMPAMDYNPTAPATATDDELLPRADMPQTPPMHPLILGLIQHLPEPGAAWPAEKRKHWLTTADHVFGLLYPDGD